jgi:hypothetical protein
MLAWLHEHRPVAVGVLVGLTCVAMAVLWDLIEPFIPRVVSFQDPIGRSLLVFTGILLILLVARKRGLLRRPSAR